MTSEEIKKQVSMQEVLSRYGIKVGRNHMASCPFHGADKHPSMRVYEDGFHCFTCGAHGDIFTFVMQRDNLSFKQAFMLFGGNYQKQDFHSKLAVYRAQKQRLERQKEEAKKATERKRNNKLLTAYRGLMDASSRASEDWIYWHNKLQYQIYLHGILNGLERGWAGEY